MVNYKHGAHGIDSVQPEALVVQVTVTNEREVSIKQKTHYHY